MASKGTVHLRKREKSGSETRPCDKGYLPEAHPGGPTMQPKPKHSAPCPTWPLPLLQSHPDQHCTHGICSGRTGQGPLCLPFSTTRKSVSSDMNWEESEAGNPQTQPTSTAVPAGRLSPQVSQSKDPISPSPCLQRCQTPWATYKMAISHTCHVQALCWASETSHAPPRQCS